MQSVTFLKELIAALVPQCLCLLKTKRNLILIAASPQGSENLASQFLRDLHLP